MHTEPVLIQIAPARGWQEGDSSAADDHTLFLTVKPGRKIAPTYPEKSADRLSLKKNGMIQLPHRSARAP